MFDRQALFEKLIAYLDTKPAAADYLDDALALSDAPDLQQFAAQEFDPYQMVAEWIALKQEVKQQGKLLLAAQESLQQALARSQPTEVPAETLAETLAERQSDAEKALLQDLLPIMDAIDQACEYWRSQLAALPTASPSFWQRLIPRSSNEATLKAVFLSNQQGMEVIRRSLLDLLQQRKLTPILALGQPFDPSYMYAIARQTSQAPANTVIQEVVRGYRWQGEILREAQVVVAAE